MPEIQKLADKYKDKGLVVIGPSLDAEEAVEAIRKDKGVSYLMVSEAEATADKWGVSMFPFIFLVGKDGKVLWKGWEKDENLIKALEQALATK